MRPALLISALLLAAAPTTAQNGLVSDVGLTMDGGVLTVLYGQACGPFTCAPLTAGNVGRGEIRTLTHYGAPTSLYAVAIGLPARCARIPGIDNGLLMSAPIITLSVGATSPVNAISTCRQGIARVPFLIPRTAPLGLRFHIQSLGISNSGQPAFSPAMETTIR